MFRRPPRERARDGATPNRRCAGLCRASSDARTLPVASTTAATAIAASAPTTAAASATAAADSRRATATAPSYGRGIIAAPAATTALNVASTVTWSCANGTARLTAHPVELAFLTALPLLPQLLSVLSEVASHVASV
jgi:hypothetical protein